MKFNDIAIKVLEQRYLARDNTGKIVETPEEMFLRVAKFISSADERFGSSQEEILRLEESFFNLLTSLRFLPNTPTLINAGRPLGQLSACFVLRVDDSVDGIFQAVKEGALIMKTGGGIGMAFSMLRPAGAIVESTGQPASGPVSFMRVFDVMCETIAQGGVRRGAMMGVLRVDHPDILKFINSKGDKKSFRNFNISVALTKEFMEALLHSSPYYNLIEPRSGKVVDTLDATNVFDLIAARAWETGDPGVIFIDRARDMDPVDGEQIESTNPCGEQFLAPYDSCNLGSINLRVMLKNENGFYKWDFELFRKTIYEAVHFLDNVIEVNQYPIEAIKKKTLSNRRIGLGVMGWADALALLGIPYDSDQALQEAEKISYFLTKNSEEASIDLACKRGPFPNINKSKWKKEGKVMRNAATTTIAPTGSLSILAGVTGGIEPFFAIAYKRSITAGDFNEVVPTFVEYLINKGFPQEELVKQVVEKGGSIRKMKEAPEEVKMYFPVAYDVAPEWHVKMQSAWQKYIHNSISKTVNLHRQATVDDVKRVYLLAYQEGCKGVTIYRDSSLDSQVLSVTYEPSASLENQKTEKVPLKRIFSVRPRVLRGFTRKFNTGVGSLYVTVNLGEGNKPVEVFASLSGGGAPAELEAIARLTSIALQYGIPLEVILEQLKNPLCPVTYKLSPDGLRSVAHGINRALSEAIGREEKNAITKKNELKPIISVGVLTGNNEEKPVELEDMENKPPIGFKTNNEEALNTLRETYGDDKMQVQLEGQGVEFCPECGQSLVSQEGCDTCHNCGWTKCL